MKIREAVKKQKTGGKMTETSQIYKLMKECALDSGIVILSLRSHAVDTGKQSEYHGSGMSKTIVDDIVQELFLSRLYRLNPHVRINAEEDTPSRRLFTGKEATTVHVDPLDGTRSYLDKDTYDFASGYAISDADNNFTHTVIYVPVKRKLYYTSPTEHGTLEAIDKGTGKIPAHRAGPNVVYEKRLLSEQGKEELENMGFEVRGMGGCSHMRVLDVALRNGAAYLYGVTNPHDSLIPYAFAKRCGAVALNRAGKAISGKDIILSETDGLIKFERLPSVCYFSPVIDSTEKGRILDMLGKKENLHHDYLEYLFTKGIREQM